ncbi:MAG: STAS domain-containing protein [Actinomycetota bacterium]
MNFSAETRSEADETIVLAFGGVLDLETVQAAEAAFAAAEEQQPNRVVVDLSDVEFIDSTGLRLIVSADTRIRRNGRMLQIVKGPDRVHRVFRMTLLNERLAFIDRAPGVDDPTRSS